MIHLRTITFILGVVLMHVGVFFSFGWAPALLFTGLFAAFAALKLDINFGLPRTPDDQTHAHR